MLCSSICFVVPGPVSNPRAIVSGPNAINVSWNPPSEQNGIIVGKFFYLYRKSWFNANVG